MTELFTNFLAFVGLYALCLYLYDNLKSPVLLLFDKLKTNLGCKPLNLVDRYGKWAAITGATDGIGKQYAIEFAQRGLNIVLISRTEAKLKAVAAEIENVYKVQTKVIVADFTEGEKVYSHIEKELGDLQVGIMVNNIGTVCLGKVSTFTREALWQHIYTNIAPVTLLSNFFLKRMQNAGLKGAIVNISSGIELQPTPSGTLYAAAKSYIRFFTLALQAEARPHGITVQLVSPMFIITKSSGIAKLQMKRGTFFIPDVETFTRWSVSTLGKTDETTGYYSHGIQTALQKLCDVRMRTLTSGVILAFLIDNPLKSIASIKNRLKLGSSKRETRNS